MQVHLKILKKERERELQASLKALGLWVVTVTVGCRCSLEDMPGEVLGAWSVRGETVTGIDPQKSLF